MPSKFSGENGQSALRWLRTLKYELPGDLTSNQWLEYVDGLLEGEAARWADQHPRVRKMMKEEHLKADHNKEEDVKVFEDALKRRFPSTTEAQEEALIQQPKEPLDNYYRRTETSLHIAGGVDRDEKPPPTSEESNILVERIEAYVHGLHDPELRQHIRAWYEREKDSGRIHHRGLFEYHMTTKAKLEEFEIQRERNQQTSINAGVGDPVRTFGELQAIASRPTFTFGRLAQDPINPFINLSRSNGGPSTNFGTPILEQRSCNFGDINIHAPGGGLFGNPHQSHQSTTSSSSAPTSLFTDTNTNTNTSTPNASIFPTSTGFVAASSSSPFTRLSTTAPTTTSSPFGPFGPFRGPSATAPTKTTAPTPSIFANLPTPAPVREFPGGTAPIVHPLGADTMAPGGGLVDNTSQLGAAKTAESGNAGAKAEEDVVGAGEERSVAGAEGGDGAQEEG